MKRKMIAVLFLVGICLAVLVVEGVSQPPVTPSAAPPPSPLSAPPMPQPVQPPATSPPNFARPEPGQQEWTFEQLAEALKAVRARQKELKTQEAELLAKMAEKVEEKRKDLSKAEEVLQQLRGETSVRKTSSIDPPISARKDEWRFEEKKESEKKSR
jgi:hypothetical protein